MAARSVQQEAQQLFEDLRHRLSLAAFAQGAKQPIQVGVQTQAPHIADKQAQAGASG